jgi:hypothetical protein
MHWGCHACSPSLPIGHQAAQHNALLPPSLQTTLSIVKNIHCSYPLHSHGLNHLCYFLLPPPISVCSPGLFPASALIVICRFVTRFWSCSCPVPASHLQRQFLQKPSVWCIWNHSIYSISAITMSLSSPMKVSPSSCAVHIHSDKHINTHNLSSSRTGAQSHLLILWVYLRKALSTYFTPHYLPGETGEERGETKGGDRTRRWGWLPSPFSTLSPHVNHPPTTHYFFPRWRCSRMCVTVFVLSPPLSYLV